MAQSQADQARVAQTIVRVCANGHQAVTYYARRDAPEPPCPVCQRVYRTPQEGQ